MKNKLKLIKSFFYAFLLCAASLQAQEGVQVRRVIDNSYKPPTDLSKIKVAFFDADSTLRVAPSGSVSANGSKDVLLLPYMGPYLKNLEAAGYLIAIVSNQKGVEDKIVKFETAQAALAYTVELIKAEGATVHYFDFAESVGPNRKPGIGMANNLEAELKKKFGDSAKIDKAESFMVGDSAYKKGVDKEPSGIPGTHFSNADRLFAKNYGIRFVEPADFFSWRKNGVSLFSNAAQVKDYKARVAPPQGCEIFWSAFIFEGK